MVLLLHIIVKLERSRGCEWDNEFSVCTRFEVTLTCEVAVCGVGEGRRSWWNLRSMRGQWN